MNHLREINAADFETEVLRSSGTVVVDFYAPWCGPCKMLAPVLDQFASELAGQVKIVKLNVDNAQELRRPIQHHRRPYAEALPRRPGRG